MNFAVIGAAGHTGSLVVREALARNHAVTAIIRSPKPVDPRATVLHRDLFDLTTENIVDFDAVYCCFSSGFHQDPVINKTVCEQLIGIFRDTGVHILHILGSGCLFTDGSHQTRVYECPEHPAFLKGISYNATLGLQAFERSSGVDWTVVMPSLEFAEQGGAGHYIASTAMEPLWGADGRSLVTYTDYSKAVVDMMENRSYVGQAITVLSRL